MGRFHMEKQPFKSLSEIAAAENCSHETARRAALAGRLPAFQPFGKGSVWCVALNYETFLSKSRKSGDAANEQQDDNDNIVKTG
jgi:hypothetical protein